MVTLTIGKLAKACDVKIDTIRYYERLGLLTPVERSEAGYRKYSGDSIKQLRFVRRAQSLGFALGEIKELFDLSEDPESDCADMRERARVKIREIDHLIQDMIKIRDSLNGLADFCPGKGQPLNDCGILHHFYGDDK